jgi:hypothetical protein
MDGGVAGHQARQRRLAGQASDPGANLPQGRAHDQAAAILGVSPRSAEAAGNVLKQGTPELIQGVESGQVSVSGAPDLAELPHGEQRDIVSRDKRAVAAKGTGKRALAAAGADVLVTEGGIPRARLLPLQVSRVPGLHPGAI